MLGDAAPEPLGRPEPVPKEAKKGPGGQPITPGQRRDSSLAAARN